ELSIVLQRDSQIFCRDLVVKLPVFFQICTIREESFLDLFDGIGHERIRVFDSLPWLIDEVGLDGCPLRSELLPLTRWKKNSGRFDVTGTPALKRNNIRLITRCRRRCYVLISFSLMRLV